MASKRWRSDVPTYRELCVEAGLAAVRTSYYESEDGRDICTNCGKGLIEHSYDEAEKCLQDELPDLNALLDLLEGLGMFRHSWTCPSLASGLHEVEASFESRTPPPADDQARVYDRGWFLRYGTGRTREEALVRLLLDFRARAYVPPRGARIVYRRRLQPNGQIVHRWSEIPG